MAAQASWARKLHAVNDSESFEIAHLTSGQVALDSDELYSNASPRIIGNSAALRHVLGMVRIVAPTDSTVLINGETGTGKELIAEAIHKWGGRSNGPFVKVNCAAIPAGLLESELFGHERGAYTGAVTRGIGRFERANLGTLFLDEIGDLPLELQPKLLRVMQERQFERLGGTATIQTDVRVICATHRNLVEMLDNREFRADLFYRVSVFPIELPPLRERREDIRLLVHHFAMDYAARMRKPITAIAEEFIVACTHHSWPGNVRELQNFIERSVILAGGSILNGSPSYLTGAKTSAPVTLEEAERSHILRILRQTEGVVGGRNGAANRLGMPRTTLISKMKRLGINPGQVDITRNTQPYLIVFVTAGEKAGSALPAADRIEIIAHVPLWHGVVAELTTRSHWGKDYLYVNHGPAAPATILNVTNPGAPTRAGELDGPKQEASGDLSTVAGTTALIDSSPSAPTQPTLKQTVTVLSFADPEHPTVAPQFSGVTSMLKDTERGLIYLANSHGLWVLRVIPSPDIKHENEVEQRYLHHILYDHQGFLLRSARD
jgi:DNA-binding NtrC family response regulator